LSKKPLISVIVAVHNGVKTLQRCIDSVAGQTYMHKELIIMDGGSTDGTVDILHANNDKINYWKSEPDKGIYHAWNKALEHVRGDWICFLGSDDYFWKMDVLERVAEQLSSVPVTIRVVYGRVAQVNEKGEVLQIVGDSWDKAKPRFLQGMSIPHPGLMHHSSLFAVHGKFDESYRVAGDYELLLRELKFAEAYFMPDIIVAGVQRGGISNNITLTSKVYKEEARARRQNQVFVIPYIWAWKYVKSVVRSGLIPIIGVKRTLYVTDIYRKLTGRPFYWTK